MSHLFLLLARLAIETARCSPPERRAMSAADYGRGGKQAFSARRAWIAESSREMTVFRPRRLGGCRWACFVGIWCQRHAVPARLGRVLHRTRCLQSMYIPEVRAVQ